MTKKLRRFLPLLVLVLLAILVRALGWTDYLSLDMLRQNRQILLRYVEHYPLLAPVFYMVLYTVSTALSLPGAALLSVFGGFLFGLPYALFYVLIGATLGATLIFLVAKTSIGDLLRERAGPKLKGIEEKICKDAVYYLLFMRLMPLFPFWLVNIAPAFVGIALWTFVWTTAVGILPGVFVFTQSGVGLGSLLERNEEVSLGSILTLEMRIALLALGLFILVPVLYKWWRGRKSEKNDA